METKPVQIDGIPALVWGPAAGTLWIAVHGDQSHKEDEVIRVLAGAAREKGQQVLSFDLPEHGGRQGETRRCDAPNCVEDLKHILGYARPRWGRIGLFGCSVGAYFGMLAYRDEPLLQALFLSPVVDMARIIRNMMAWFQVSEERLEREGKVATPLKTLYWDYYQYVLAHPLVWNTPTALLYGAKDELCEADTVHRFAQEAQADLTVWDEGEHFFHTEAQLGFLRRWLREKMAL